MNDLEQREGSSIKTKNVIQYASEQINELDNKNTMDGMKKISVANKKIREIILAHMAERDRIVDSNSRKNPIVTGVEIEKALQDGEYREILER